MKKVLNNNSLHQFLIVMVLLITCFITFNSNIAFSKPYLDNQQSIPIKRPINLLSLEESADTIFNMIQKVGGKPTVNEKRTTLKKNETLSSALKRIDFDNNNINKIIQAIKDVYDGKKILTTLPVGMIIDYSNPSKLTGGAIKLSYTKTKDVFVWQDVNNNYFSQIYLRPTKLENILQLLFTNLFEAY